MSVHRKDRRWVVRWRADGRQKSKSFSTKREAVEFERVCQRDAWRDSVAMPQGAVSAARADEGASFAVCEDVYSDSPMGTKSRAQRPIHDGYFLTIGEAESYRRQMPDADALCIVVMYDRYLVRDLTDDEIAAGEVGPNETDDRIKQAIARSKERSS
jgi:hypothetical protein